MHSPIIQKLINLFSQFPTIGPRTATRFVFYLLNLSDKEIKELALTITELKENIELCAFCLKSFSPSTASSGNELCEICSSPNRDKSLLCVVANETDLISLEKTKKYQGLYFILGNTFSGLRKERLKNLRIKEFLERIKNSKVKEIIIALNPTTEGEATTLYLERILKPLNKKTTRLGRGLPVGGELEYADNETLSSAIELRR